MAQDGKISIKAVSAIRHVLSPKKPQSHNNIEKQTIPEPRQEFDENGLKKANVGEGPHPNLLQRHWQWFLLLTIICTVVIVVAIVVGARGISGDTSMGAAPFGPPMMSYTTISTSPIPYVSNILQSQSRQGEEDTNMNLT